MRFQLIDRHHLLQLAFTGVCAAFLAISPATGQEQRNLAVRSAATTAPAAEKRVALVIGNSTYLKGPLRNPVNDATDVAARLRASGFEVIERTNIKTSQIGRTLREFRAQLTPGAVALFFYAGHGLQIRGENYLPAVDADIEAEEDAPNQSIAMRQIMEIMEDAKTRLNLAFLDACRNNPYARSFRSGADGLARVSAPSGTLISFATRPGSVAADGTGRNGLYTTHLLQAMDAPNLQVELMLKRVNSNVKQASQGRQEPWLEGSIEGDFYFRRGATDASGNPAQSTIDQAVQDAVRRANEQSAREKAELQATMQRMIEEALTRQNAAAAGGSTSRPAPTPSPIPTAAPATTVAALAPSATSTVAAQAFSDYSRAPQPGDEWEYAVKEKVFGKSWKVLWRVKGASPGVGVMEEMQVNGMPVQERVFDGKAVMVGVPTDAALFFSSHWVGETPPAELDAQGVGECVTPHRCFISKLHLAGKESIQVAAGRFDALRYEGDVYVMLSINPVRRYAGQVQIWYSPEHRRLLKQVVTRVPLGGYLAYNLNETTELVAVRTRP